MKHRKFVFVSTLIMLGMAVAVAGVAFYTNYSVKASAPSLPDALGNLPADYEFVFGINVPKFVASPAYAKFRQNQNRNQNPQIGNDLALFTEQTGVDPARDVSYLVAAGRSGEKAKGEGVVIVVGAFSKDKITAYIRSKTTPVETEYGGMTVLMIPERSGDAVNKGIVFLNAREIALGNLESLKAVVDVKVRGNRSILLNPAMASLINGINPDEMFWFAGDASSIMSRAPVTTPLGTNIASVQSIVGTLNVTDAVSGKITAVAANADAAAKLADVVRGFVALGQLSADQNPDLKALMSGLAVSQNSTQISVTLNFPADLLEKLEQAKRQPRATAGS